MTKIPPEELKKLKVICREAGHQFTDDEVHEIGERIIRYLVAMGPENESTQTDPCYGVEEEPLGHR